MPGRATHWLAFGLTLLWGVALFAGVAVLQRPQFAPEVGNLLRPLWALVVALFIVAAGLGMGWAAVRALALPATNGEGWLVAALLGLGAVGVGWLVMGLVRLPPPWLAAVLLALPVLGLVPWRAPLPTRPKLHTALWALLLTLGGLALLQALEPPTGFDSLLYHLRAPELWLAQGSVFQAQKAAPYFHPAQMVALFTLAMQLGGERAPAVLHWMYMVLCLALLWQTTRRFLPLVSAPLVLALAVTLQMVPILGGRAYTDLALAAYQIGTVWALLHWRAQPGSRWHWVAAAFAGMAMGIKYLSVLTPVMALLVIVWHRRRMALPAALQFCVIAGLVASPSYLRNLLATGNPFFPFALPSPYWDEFRAAWWAAAGTGTGWSLPALLSVPWLATLGLRDAAYYDGRTGPLVATFAPLAGWFWLRGAGRLAEREAVGLMGGFALGYGLLWLLGVASSALLWQSRFLATPLLLLCPAIAWGIGQLEPLATAQFSPARVARLFVAVWAVVAVLIALAEFGRTDPVQALLGRADEEWFQSQVGSYAGLVGELNRLPPNSRALSLFEPRSYRMPIATEADTLLYEYSWRLQRVGGDAARLTPQLCGEGFTDVAIYWRGAQFLNTEDSANMLSDDEFAQLETWAASQERVWLAENREHELLRLRCE